MKTQNPRPFINTDAADHAVETQYAVEHHGKELHPEPKSRKSSAKKSSDEPWQID